MFVCVCVREREREKENGPNEQITVCILHLSLHFLKMFSTQYHVVIVLLLNI